MTHRTRALRQTFGYLHNALALGVPVTARSIATTNLQSVDVWHEPIDGDVFLSAPRLSVIAMVVQFPRTARTKTTFGVGMDPALKNFVLGAAAKPIEGVVEGTLCGAAAEQHPFLQVGKPIANGHEPHHRVRIYGTFPDETADCVRIASAAAARYIFSTAIFWQPRGERIAEPHFDFQPQLEDAIRKRQTAFHQFMQAGHNHLLLLQAQKMFDQAARCFLNIGETALAADAYLWGAMALEQGRARGRGERERLRTLATELFVATGLPFGKALAQSSLRLPHSAAQLFGGVTA